MKLYEITESVKQLQAMADSGELSEEDIEDTLEALEGEFELKAESVLKVRQSMLAKVVVIEKEIERLMELKKAPENSAGHLGDYIKNNMISLNKDKLDLGIFRVTLKKPSVKLGSVDESKLPDTFFNVIPEQRKLDRSSLLRAAKSEHIEGVELCETERALIIK